MRKDLEKSATLSYRLYSLVVNSIWIISIKINLYKSILDKENSNKNYS